MYCRVAEIRSTVHVLAPHVKAGSSASAARSVVATVAPFCIQQLPVRLGSACVRPSVSAVRRLSDAILWLGAYWSMHVLITAPSLARRTARPRVATLQPQV